MPKSTCSWSCDLKMWLGSDIIRSSRLLNYLFVLQKFYLDFLALSREFNKYFINTHKNTEFLVGDNSGEIYLQ